MEIVKGLAHIGLWVKNMDETVEFYRDKLGMSIIIEKDFHDDETEKDISIRFFEKGSLVIEAIYCPGDNLPDCGRIEHIAVSVSDINKVKEELENKGVIFPGEITMDPLIGERGCKYITFFGPSGEKVELNEML